MENEFLSDDSLRDIVKKSKRQLPTDNFEDKVMAKIRHEMELKTQVSKKLKLSLLFFIVGTVLGVGGTLCAILFFDAIWGLSLKNLGLIVLLVICVLGVMGFDNLRRLLHNYTI